jgi:UDP-N-acetylglucosamine 4,6-dehydratase
MVTGAGGSIGSELCFKIAEYKPKALIGLDQGESALFETEQHLRNRFPELCFVPWLCNIQNEQRLVRAVTTYQPEVVYHAAAYKYVPMLETQ